MTKHNNTLPEEELKVDKSKIYELEKALLENTISQISEKFEDILTLKEEIDSAN